MREREREREREKEREREMVWSEMCILFYQYWLSPEDEIQSFYKTICGSYLKYNDAK